METARRRRLRVTAMLLLSVLVWAVWAVGPVRAAPASPGATSVTGTVFWDENANGLRDPGEAGAPGVRVTGGRRTAVTDDAGRYALSAEEPFITVAVSFPSGAWPTTGWFHRLEQAQESGVDFGLRRDDQKLPLVFVQFTDPHGAQPVTMPKVLEECKALPLAPKFYICTGDMRSGDPSVRNVPELEESFSVIGENFEQFPAPLFMVPGNHDTVGYGGTSRQVIEPGDVDHPLFGNRCWERYVCPSYWSFSCAGVHFMGVEYAQYLDGRWNRRAPDTEAWLRGELAELPEGARTVLSAHSPGRGQTAVDLGLTLGLFGDSHTEGPYCRPGSEEPEFPDNALVGGLCQIARRGERTYTCQDGRPMGYRIVVVEADRIDTFYKAFDEPHTIMVNRPRRFVTLRASESLEVRGQFFDPDDRIAEVTVSLGGRQVRASVQRRRFWGDFEATLDVSGLPEGFHDLTVTTASARGKHSLTEPYLLLTGREEDFVAAGPATLTGTVRRVEKPCTLLVNGQEVGSVGPDAAGGRFAIEVPTGLLKRLNRVSLRSGGGSTPRLADVHMVYDGRDVLDQHRVFAWGYDHRLEPGRELYFDLTVPGPPVQWHVRTEE